MKKWLQQVIAAFCIIAIACSAGNTVALAESNNGKFVLLNIAGYDEAGQETVQEDNVFYVKGNVLYAPVQTFEKYTMYNYDPENNAFVRIGQDYKHANSKIVLNFENKTADVFYSSSQKETINIEFYQFNDTYFLPLAAFAAYLKASVIYKDSETVSIVSSGISLSDAMYNYSPYQSCLSYSDLENDIFAGNSALFQTACVLGYFGETVFSFKVSNLLGNYGDYQKYLDILESAVTNNEPYEQIFNNDDLLTEVLDSAGELGNKIYDKAHTVYKLSSNTVVTLFEEFKTSNLPDANEAFNNFFPDEQAEIDQIKSFSECVDAVDLFLDVTEYYQKFYAMNQDNRNAIGLFSPVQEYDIRALALNEIAELYNNSVVEGAGKQIGGEIVSELLKDSAGTGAEKFMTGANKVKLATSIVNSVFKAAGFDLSDNSGYDVMLAGQLKSFVLNSTDENKDNLNTLENCQNMRLKQILGILIDIQSYKMGNKFAAKYSSAGIYDKRIEDANKRLALFYLAKESEKFDSVEGIKSITKQNSKQISELDFSNLDSIASGDVVRYLSTNRAELELQKRQWNANNSAGFDYDADTFVYSQYHNGTYDIILKDASGNEKTILNISTNLLVLNDDRLFYVDDKKIYQCGLNGKNISLFFDPKIKSEYFYISHLIPLGNNKLLFTVAIGDGAGGTASVCILHLHSGEYMELDFHSNDVWNFYTHGDYLYYQESEYDVYTNKFYGDKLIKYNLNSNKSEHVDINFEERSLKGVFGNTLYSLKRPDPELMEEDWIKSIAVSIYKLDLNTLEESIVNTYGSNEPVHDVLVYDDKVFFTTGTGAGNGFAVLEEKGELNYDNKKILDHDGLLGENLGLYGEYIICNCWDGMDGEEYGYQRIYKIE